MSHPDAGLTSRSEGPGCALETDEVDDGFRGCGVTLAARSSCCSQSLFCWSWLLQPLAALYISLRISLRGGHLVTLNLRLLFLFSQGVDTTLSRTIALSQALYLAHQLLDWFRGAKCSS